MFPDKALLAETFVEYHRGQWIVYIEVIFKDEIVKKEVGRYFTKKK
ncbi:MAG: AP2 domain-containing protein, partial [Aquifex sp.]